MRRILDSMTATPAYVRNARLDILAANRLGAALMSPVITSPAQPANNARFLFLDPAAPEFYTDWERQAQDVVAMLRTEAGRSPHDKALSNLIGELSTRSENFRTWWAAHNVRFHRTGVKRFHHPAVGDLTRLERGSPGTPNDRPSRRQPAGDCLESRQQRQLSQGSRVSHESRHIQGTRSG